MGYPRFRFGSFMVRVASCDDTTQGFLSPPPLCVPLSCLYLSVCRPPDFSMAVVTYGRGDDPAELRRMLSQLNELKLQAVVVVKESADEPGAATNALKRALEG